MLDIGLGELIVMAVLALLVFGPDKLPKAAAEAARTMRGLRAAAASARRDLSDEAGLDADPELARTMRDLRDLDPRRVLAGNDEGPAAARGPSAARPPSGTGPERASGAASAGPGDSPTPPAPHADPDWT